MGKRRVLPTTDIINKFNALGETEKLMVFDYIKSQAGTQRPKSSKSAPRAQRSSSANKSATSGAASSATAKDGALAAGGSGD
jgi:hypothetical protein